MVKVIRDISYTIAVFINLIRVAYQGGVVFNIHDPISVRVLIGFCSNRLQLDGCSCIFRNKDITLSDRNRNLWSTIF